MNKRFALLLATASLLAIPLSSSAQSVPAPVQTACAQKGTTASASVYQGQANMYQCNYTVTNDAGNSSATVYLNPDGTKATLNNGASMASEGVQLNQNGDAVAQPGVVSIAGSQDAPPTFKPLAPVGQGSVLGNLYGTGGSTNGSLGGYLNALFKFAISIGALVSVFMFVFAGYQYMFNDKLSSKLKAKDIFSNVLLGTVVLLGCWLILYQINPDLLNLDVLHNVSSSSNLSSCSGPIGSTQNC